jgi:alpha-beta hydrolase superfamily lysophospholipase
VTVLAFALAMTGLGRAHAEKAKAKAAAETPPAPQNVFLPTADGWRIHGTYYPPQPGVRRGQEVVPILAVHGWGGQAMEYQTPALGLQRLGHAVLTLDLRGHGRSTRWRGPDGEFQTVDYEALDPLQVFGTLQDLEAGKRFLVQRNNAGELNIDRLVVVAAGEGCIAALNWTAQDWSWPPTTAGKQGQDVQALVLLSPILTRGRVTARQALDHPAIRSWVSVMIAAGRNERRPWSEAQRLYARLEQGREALPEEPSERLKKQSLFLFGEDTSMQGVRLLDRHLSIARHVAMFIDLRLVFRAYKWPWAERTSPLGE